MKRSGRSNTRPLYNRLLIGPPNAKPIFYMIRRLVLISFWFFHTSLLCAAEPGQDVIDYRWLAIAGLLPLLGGVIFYVYRANRRLQSSLIALGSANTQLWLFQEAIEYSPVSMMIVDTHNRIEYVNRHFCQMSGFSAAELIGAEPGILRSEENPPELYRQIQQTLERGEIWRGELIDRHHAGNTYWVDLQIAPVKNDRGEVSHYVYVKQDINERKQAEIRLHQSESLFRSLVESANDLIYSHDPEGVMTYVSPNIREIIGYAADEVVGRPFDAYIHPDDLPATLQFTEQALINKTKNSGLVYRIMHKDGDWRWHTTNEAPLFDVSGQLTGLIGITRDISEIVKLQQELEQQARSDFLTGLHNRRYFMEKANQELGRCMRYQKPLALMMLDIDHFKRINDGYGHQAGDQVLVSLAQVCKTVLREVDEVGRIGGEEFAILLPESDAQSGMAAAERLRKALADTTVPVDPSGVELHFTVSIGVSTLPPGSTLDNLLRSADAALYQAKDSGRNQVVLSADS